jgi:hypothetical protein
VNVDQFYGIEIENFPCEVARVSLWLMDHLMNRQATAELGQYYIRLPLTQSATIVHGNALRIDWETIVSKDDLAYIISNPPYKGYKYRKDWQKEDMRLILPQTQNLDYVAAWYKKAADMMSGTVIRTGFVSTNSITQGEQVALLWKPLIERSIHIDFAYRTFKWRNEAKGKAAVHCVIIGFSFSTTMPKYIFDGKSKNVALRINPYLVDAPDIFIERRNQPLCKSPNMVAGNKPVDYNHLKIEAEDYKEFVKNDPLSKKHIRRMIGAEEFINNQKRYCLWLVGVAPEELRKMPEVMKRISACRDARLKSIDAGAKKLADTPTLFRETMNPNKYLVIPAVSSERRKYIPIGYFFKDTIPVMGLLIIPDATLYHFGVLTSGVHMAWTRAVCGRLRTDYRYSKDIVYNNFPWADATDEQKENIAKLAQNVLYARDMFPDSSLADLYDPLTMPPELLKAHQALDRSVMKLYRFKTDIAEAEIVARLMEMYQKLTTPQTLIPEPQPKKVRKRT